MKANELMIGDWVCCTDPTPFKIEAITIIDFPEYVTGSDGFDVEISDLQPIPLTAEILEKNGFKIFNFVNIKGSHKWTWWCDMQTFVSFWCRELNDDTKEGWMLRVESPFTSSRIKIEYVHELQHALRLCEIDKTIEL